jgi:hypothetical protein
MPDRAISIDRVGHFQQKKLDQGNKGEDLI